MMNLRPQNRLKTSSTSKRKPKDDYRNIDEDLQSIEHNHPLHFKLKTRSGLATERIVKSSISDRNSIDIQNLLYEKDKTILKLRNKLVSKLKLINLGRVRRQKTVPKSRCLSLKIIIIYI